MSFRCQKCGTAQPSGARPRRVVTRWRTFGGTYYTPPMRQIAEEQNWCDECFDAFEAEKEPETVMGQALKTSLEDRCAS
jgi:hypothetical protein